VGWVGSKLTVTVLQWLKWIVEEDTGRYLGQDPGVSLQARGHLLGSNAADTRLGVLFHASSSEWDELHLEASDLHVGSARQCQKHAYTYWPAPGTAAFEIRAMKVRIPNTPAN